jgi:hypothetical protein
MILQLFFFARSIALWFSQQKGRGVDHPKKKQNDAETQFRDGQFCSFVVGNPKHVVDG